MAGSVVGGTCSERSSLPTEYVHLVVILVLSRRAEDILPDRRCYAVSHIEIYLLRLALQTFNNRLLQRVSKSDDVKITGTTNQELHSPPTVSRRSIKEITGSLELQQRGRSNLACRPVYNNRRDHHL